MVLEGQIVKLINHAPRHTKVMLSRAPGTYKNINILMGRLLVVGD
jgi:hypothetical protein